MPAPLFAPMASIFLRTFGERTLAQYSENGAAAKPIRCIFNEAYAETDVNGIPIEDTRPTAWVATSDAPNASNRDRITVGGKEWKLVSCKADGKGMTELVLGSL